MRTLKGMYGVTKFDRVRTECIKKCYKVTHMAGKMK